jgi:hypothetical protein
MLHSIDLDLNKTRPRFEQSDIEPEGISKLAYASTIHCSSGRFA